MAEKIFFKGNGNQDYEVPVIKVHTTCSRQWRCWIERGSSAFP